MNQCPQAPKYSIGAVLNFCENLWRYSRMNIYKLFNGVNDTSKKFIAGVNDTAEKLFNGVNDTADKLFGGVNCQRHWR
jgi:hypothetical protein